MTTYGKDGKNRNDENQNHAYGMTPEDESTLIYEAIA